MGIPLRSSAPGLPQVLGEGRYQTAWAWLHKLRRAMNRPDRERLAGHVEVDETHWGSTARGSRGRHTVSKILSAVSHFGCDDFFKWSISFETIGVIML